MSSVRHARAADVEAIRACLLAAFAAYRDQYSDDAFADTVPSVGALRQRLRTMTVLVAEDDSGEVVGTIAHSVAAPDEGHLRGMAVHPRALGAGIAQTLLDAAESELAGLGCTRVTLDTTLPLQRAIRFYQRCGYAATGRVSDFFGMPLFEYAKELPARENDPDGWREA